MTMRKKPQEILFHAFEELSCCFETLMISNKLAKQNQEKYIRAVFKQEAAGPKVTNMTS